MEKKDLVVNLEFKCKGNKGRVIKIEDDFFSVLWIDTKQFYDYPYDKGLLKSMVVEVKEEVEIKEDVEVKKKPGRPKTKKVEEN
ncbi:MAG: hypothetical protein WDA59_10720 [Methanofastidiosum sp.]